MHCPNGQKVSYLLQLMDELHVSDNAFDQRIPLRFGQTKRTQNQQGQWQELKQG